MCISRLQNVDALILDHLNPLKNPLIPLITLNYLNPLNPLNGFVHSQPDGFKNCAGSLRQGCLMGGVSFDLMDLQTRVESIEG